MKKPRRRLLKQIFATGNRACHFPVVGVDDEDEWLENYLDQNDGEEPSYDMDNQPTFTFAYVKSLLPEGVSLDNCFCSVYFDEDHLRIKVFQDLGPNPDFKSNHEEYKAWTKSKMEEWEKIQDEDDIKNLERQIAKIKAKWA